ncbi:hypothetical protein D3C80_1109380 [compost metagenome]
MQEVAFVEGIEVTLAKAQVAATEGIAPVHGLPGLGDGTGADVHAVDQERPRRNAGIEQGHGQRIGFLTGRARQAEQAQRARPGQLGQALVRQAGQGGERFGVTEEPGFRDDDRFDQRLLLIHRLLQVQPVIIQVGGVHGHATLAQSTLDHGRAHRFHVQADAFAQEAEKMLFVHVGIPVGSSAYSNSCTASGSRSLTSMRCNKPCSS